MPHRAIGDQGVPPRCAPRLSDAAFFKNQKRHTLFAKMFAQRDACLSGANDERVYLFD